MPFRICRISTLLGRPPGLAEGIKGSRMAHSWSERSLAYGFIEVISSSLSTSFSLNYSYYTIFPAADFASSALSPGLFVQPLDDRRGRDGNSASSTWKHLDNSVKYEGAF